MTKEEINAFVYELTQLFDSNKIATAIDKAIFDLSIAEVEYPCACYYLAKLYEALYTYCSNEANFKMEAMSVSQNLSMQMASEYGEKYNYYWEMAIRRSEPHALFDVAMSIRGNAKRQDEFRHLVKRAADSGYPIAVYNYAKIIREESPSKAKELIDSVKHFASVRNEIELEEKLEQREREEELEEEAFWTWHDKFVDWREESGWNDVYGRGVDASDIIEF